MMFEEKTESSRAYFLGFDGGGTKTDCVLMDAGGEVLARASAGPSNPLRAGYARAWFTLGDAADTVLERHGLRSPDIRGICAGIGGAGRDAVARKLTTYLERSFPEAAVEVTTDLAIALEAAVGEGEGIILVVGTGSGAFGRNARGETARAGGRGPWFSDEGSGFDVGRRALAAAVRAEEGRGPATALSEQVLKWLGSRDWAHVLDWVIKNPDDVFPRVFPLVARLGDKGDPVAQEILSNAAISLAQLAESVSKKLFPSDHEITITKFGGAIGRSKFFDDEIDAELHRMAPKARIGILEAKPAEAAARRAIRSAQRKAHAG